MKALESQKDQFLDLLESNKKIIFKVVNSFSYNTEDRKDLCQEIILQLWKAFPKYNDTYAITTWIYRIALNVSISFRRKEKTRETTQSGYFQNFDLLHWDDSVINEQLKQLYQFIELLKPFDKAIIILYLEGHKNKEIAEITGISETNVSSKLSRIKKKLSSNLKS